MNIKKTSKGFTLIELLVAMAILSVLLLLLTSLLGQIQNTWVSAKDRIGQYREARVAFDIITKNVSQASLNTYWDYKYDDQNFPESYERRSELQFKVCPASDLGSIAGGTTHGQALFFQAPLGFSTKYRNLNNLYNGRGYFVVYGDDAKFKPSFVNAPEKMRFRLMEFRPPAEANQIFEDGLEERNMGNDAVLQKWWKQAMTVGSQSGAFIDFMHPLADNIIALVVSPRDTLEKSGNDRRDTYSEIAPRYEFDSNANLDPKYSDQVPPLVRVTMVAIDETAGIRTEDANNAREMVSKTLFVDTNRYDDDIATLSKSLSEKGINYKVFSTIVMMRSSRWSTFVVDPAN